MVQTESMGARLPSWVGWAGLGKLSRSILKDRTEELTDKTKNRYAEDYLQALEISPRYVTATILVLMLPKGNR